MRPIFIHHLKWWKKAGPLVDWVSVVRPKFNRHCKWLQVNNFQKIPFCSFIQEFGKKFYLKVLLCRKLKNQSNFWMKWWTNEIYWKLSTCTVAGYDFLVLPIVHPRFRHSFELQSTRPYSFTRSDLLLTSSEWTSLVVGVISR